MHSERWGDRLSKRPKGVRMVGGKERQQHSTAVCEGREEDRLGEAVQALGG